MPSFKEGLRYRGSDKKIKDQNKKKASDNQEKFILTSFNSKRDNNVKICSITDRPEYHNPPKGVKVSYAYGESPSTLYKIWNDAQVLYAEVAAQLGLSKNLTGAKPPTITEVQNSYSKLIQWLSAAPNNLKKFYDSFPFPEKQLIHTVAKKVSNYHFANYAMTTFHINPVTFVLLSIAAGSYSSALADSPTDYNITDGFPPGGNDVCSNIKDALKCEQFYVSKNGTALATSYSLLYGEYADSGNSDAAKKVWDCMKSDSIKDVMRQVIANPNIEPKFGTETVDIIGYAPQTQMEFNIQGVSDNTWAEVYNSKAGCDYTPPNTPGLEPLVKWSLVGMGITAGASILCTIGIMCQNRRKNRMVERDYLTETDSAVSPAIPLSAVEVNVSGDNNPALNDSVGHLASIVDTATPNQPSTHALELQNRKQNRSVY